MGATTRDPNIDILVETGTPPSFQRTSPLWRRCRDLVKLAVAIEMVDDRLSVE